MPQACSCPRKVCLGDLPFSQKRNRWNEANCKKGCAGINHLTISPQLYSGDGLNSHSHIAVSPCCLPSWLGALQKKYDVVRVCLSWTPWAFKCRSSTFLLLLLVRAAHTHPLNEQRCSMLMQRGGGGESGVGTQSRHHGGEGGGGWVRLKKQWWFWHCWGETKPSPQLHNRWF